MLPLLNQKHKKDFIFSFISFFWMFNFLLNMKSRKYKKKEKTFLFPFHKYFETNFNYFDFPNIRPQKFCVLNFLKY